MKLAYQAYDRSGAATTATIEAANVTEAADTLRRKGLYVTRIAGADGGAGAAAPARRPSTGRGRRLKQVVMFTRQLHVLVASGTPMVQALAALERQAREKHWHAAISDVRLRVEQGLALSDALHLHPEYFDEICCSLIAAGESSGHLPEMLDRLGVMTRKQLHIRNALVGAMIYPCLLLTITTGVMSVLLLFVIPRFGELFAGMKVPLPPTTQALVSLGKLLQTYWWAAAGLLAAAAVGLKCWLASPAGRRGWDTLALRLPTVGRLTRSFATARIARILGVLLGGHVPILEALEMTQRSAGNAHYAALLATARDTVSRGEPMSSVLANTDLISPAVYEAVHNGEQSGQMGSLLLNIADFLDEDNEVIVKSLTSILEPAILVGMGLVVGLMAISMFLPLFDLTSMTGGGSG